MPFANSGRLRHYVDIQTLVSNGDFRDHEAWLTTVSAWAEIAPNRGQKPIHADQLAPNVTHIIKMRTNENKITPQNRLKYGDRIFAIRYVTDNDEDGHYFELGCTEEV